MKTLRSVNGHFTGHDLGSGAWRLSTDIPGGPEIHLAGVVTDAAETLGRAGAGAVEIDWRPDGRAPHADLGGYRSERPGPPCSHS